jgi:hypothetical protein
MGWLETAIPDELWIELRAEGLLEPGVPGPGREVEE